jgi:hypothetical protein
MNEFEADDDGLEWETDMYEAGEFQNGKLAQSKLTFYFHPQLYPIFVLCSDQGDEFDGFEEEDRQEQLDMDLFSNVQYCMWPTLEDTLYNFLIPLLFANLALKVILLVNQAIRGRSVKLREHLLIVTGSVAILLFYFREQVWEATLGITLVAIAFIVCFVLHSRCNHLWWMFVGLLIAFNELHIFWMSKIHLRFRPLLMLVFMKQLTIRQELLKITAVGRLLDFESFAACFAYLFHPQCLPLGGWNPICQSDAATATSSLQTETDQISEKHNRKRPKVKAEATNEVNVQTTCDFVNIFLFPIVKGCCFLVGSNCIVHVLMLFIEAHVLPLLFHLIGSTLFAIVKGFLNAYFVALQFRFSHYFICFIMQSLHAIWGSK